MAVREGYIQVLAICLLFIQDAHQQVPEPIKVNSIGNNEEHVSCPEGSVAVVTKVKYNIGHKRIHPCHKFGIGLMNALCKFNRYCLLKKSDHCRSKSHTVYTVDVSVNCIPSADVHRGCVSRINPVDEQFGYGVIASENYPAAKAPRDCGFQFVHKERLAVKLTILDCFFDVTIDNTLLCDSNTELPIERTINTTSWIRYKQKPRFYEGFLALYTGPFVKDFSTEHFETTAGIHYLTNKRTVSTHTESTVHDTFGLSTEKGQAGDQRNSGKYMNHGLVIGLILLSMTVILVAAGAGSYFLYHRFWKSRRKYDPVPGVNYKPPHTSFRAVNSYFDGDQAEVMYDTVHDGATGSSDDNQQYACVEYQTCPGISDVNMAGSNPGQIGAAEREYMDVDMSGGSCSSSNNLHEQTESTQQAPLYAEVKKAKAVVGKQSDKISPDQPDTGPLNAQVNEHSGGPVYDQVNKDSPYKPDLGPVYAEVNKPKKRAAYSDTSEDRSVYVTTQGVWSGTDAH